MIADSPEELRELVCEVPLQRDPFWVRRVIRVIEEAVGVPPGTVRSRGRTTPETWARFIVVAVLRDEGLSYTQIGAAIQKDHTTAIHAIRRVGELLESDPFFAGMYNHVVERMA